MKLIYLPLLVILYLVPANSFADPIDNVAALIRQGNIHELSKLFAPNVDITVLNDENVYSKDRAAVILDKFFSEHKPIAVKMLHKVNSNSNYQFGVLIFIAEKETFRIAYTLKGIEGNLRLIDLRIETEKVK